MSYYERASKKVINWIESDPDRMADFKRICPYSVQTYLSLFAYKPTVVVDLVRAMLVFENERTVKRLTSL